MTYLSYLNGSIRQTKPEREEGQGQDLD
jgi:hypothetical protein